MTSNYQHGGNLAKAAVKFGKTEKDFIDYSASINPLGASPLVWQAIHDNLWRINHYPDPNCGELQEGLATYLGVSLENIILGNGGAEIIYTLPSVVSLTKSVVVVPTFGEYAQSLLANNKEVSFYKMPLEGDSSSYLEKLTKSLENQMVFICNPNNPTGRLYSKEELRFLVEGAGKRNSVVVVDEAFNDFVQDKEKYSLMPYVEQYPNLLVSYSLTKFFAIPGLRLGAAVASASLINELQKKLDPWRINTLAQVAGIAALKDIGHQEKTLELITREKEFLFNNLSQIDGLRPLLGAANFLLIEFTSLNREKLEKLIFYLGEKGILVRDCGNFEGLSGSFIRIAVRTRKENEKLLQAIKLSLEKI